MSTDRSLQTLTAEDFRGCRGSWFRLTGVAREDGSPAWIDVELAHVTEHSAAVAGPFRAPFTVLFHGPLEPVLSQGTCRAEHEQLGTLELFVVPVGPDEPAAPGKATTVMLYEAVFG